MSKVQKVATFLIATVLIALGAVFVVAVLEALLNINIPSVVTGALSATMLVAWLLLSKRARAIFD